MTHEEFAANADRPPERSLLSYVELFRRRWWAAVACLLVAVTFASIFAIVQRPLYEAEAQVVLNRQNLANALTGTPDPNQSAGDFLRIVTTRAKLARSPAVAQAVIDRRPGQYEDASSFLAVSSAKPFENADMLRFGVKSASPEQAVRFVNTYADEFVAYMRELDTRSLQRALTQLSARIDEVRRDGSANASLVTQLAAKEQELRTLEALQTANATVVGRSKSAVKVSPQVKKYLAISVVGGLCLAFIVVLAVEALDTRVRSAADAESELGMPLLGHVPAPPQFVGDGLLSLMDPQYPDIEALRIVGANVGFAMPGAGPKTLLVTSSVPREGKTTTTANLAVTLSRAGHRVVLFDLDLRRPAVHGRFGVAQVPGISDVVRGTHGLADVAHAIDIGSGDGVGSLSVVAAGTTPPDPGELMRRPSLRHALSEAIDDGADFVLLDTPPTLPIADAMVLSAFVDGIIVVARIPIVKRNMLRSLRRAISASPTPALGFIATGVEKSGAAGSYGYGYEYGGEGRAVAADAP